MQPPYDITFIKTDSTNQDFRVLVTELDADLKIRDGADHGFYAQFNKIDAIKHVIVAYLDNKPVGCGAFKEYSSHAAEIKRMYVPITERGKGIASAILGELENWAKNTGYQSCILETGKKQPEAINLYKKSGYSIIKNYGQYENVENSICFEKRLE